MSGIVSSLAFLSEVELIEGEAVSRSVLYFRLFRIEKVCRYVVGMSQDAPFARCGHAPAVPVEALEELGREVEVALEARSIHDHEGRIGSLRRFKDDASEVKNGLECGIAFERYADIKVGDVIEVFSVEQIAPTV